MTLKPIDLADRLPSFIEIETSNKCNRSCDWCPTGSDTMRRHQELMRWSLLARILTQLGELSYSGWIALHNYNEPLLNTRLLDEVTLVNSLVPGARPSIFTNGDMLDDRRLAALVEAGVVHVRVTRYPRQKGLDEKRDPALVLKEWLRRRGLWDKYSWELRAAPQGLLAEFRSDSVLLQVFRPSIATYNYRGGTIPDLASPGRTAPCQLTTTSSAIARLGQMKMCCNVYPSARGHDEYLIGSLLEHTFSELWFSQRMEDLSIRHRRADWSTSSICSACSHREITQAHDSNDD